MYELCEYVPIFEYHCDEVHVLPEELNRIVDPGRMLACFPDEKNITFLGISFVNSDLVPGELLENFSQKILPVLREAFGDRLQFKKKSIQTST